MNVRPFGEGDFEAVGRRIARAHKATSGYLDGLG